MESGELLIDSFHVVILPGLDGLTFSSQLGEHVPLAGEDGLGDTLFHGHGLLLTSGFADRPLNTVKDDLGGSELTDGGPRTDTACGDDIHPESYTSGSGSLPFGGIVGFLSSVCNLMGKWGALHSGAKSDETGAGGFA